MTPIDITAIVSSIAGSTFLVEIVKGIVARRKTNADASVALANTMLTWQATLMSRIEALEKDVKECNAAHEEKDQVILELRTRNTDLEKRIAALELQMPKSS